LWTIRSSSSSSSSSSSNNNDDEEGLVEERTQSIENKNRDSASYPNNGIRNRIQNENKRRRSNVGNMDIHMDMDTNRNLYYRERQGHNDGSRNSRYNNDYYSNNNDRDRRLDTTSKSYHHRRRRRDQHHQERRQSDYNRNNDHYQRDSNDRNTRDDRYYRSRYSTGGENNSRKHNINNNNNYRRNSDYNNGEGEAKKGHGRQKHQQEWSTPQQSQSHSTTSKSNSDGKDFKNNNSNNGSDTTNRNGGSEHTRNKSTREIGNTTIVSTVAINNDTFKGKRESRCDWKSDGEEIMTSSPSMFMLMGSRRRRHDDKRKYKGTLIVSRASSMVDHNHNKIHINTNTNTNGKQLKNVASESSVDDIRAACPIDSTREQEQEQEQERKQDCTKSFASSAVFSQPAIVNRNKNKDRGSVTAIAENYQAEHLQKSSFPPPSSGNNDKNSNKRHFPGNNSRDDERNQYPLGKRQRQREEKEKVASIASTSSNREISTSNISRSTPQQTLEETTNGMKYIKYWRKSTIQETLSKEASITTFSKVGGEKEVSINVMKKTQISQTQENNSNNFKPPSPSKAKAKNATTMKSISAPSLMVKKKVHTKPTTNKLGIPMRWLKAKAKPILKKKISVPSQSTLSSIIERKSTKDAMMTINKKTTIRASSPSKDKCLVTDSSEGGSIVSYSKKKRKGSSIPVAIVTNKSKKKNTQGGNHSRIADNGNIEARKDEWDSGAESDPEGSESDESDLEDSRSDIDDEEIHNSSSNSTHPIDPSNHRNKLPTANPSKSPKLKIRLLSNKLEQLSKLRLIPDSQEVISLDLKNDDDVKLNAALKREKKKQEKLMALSIMISERPEFDHEKAKQEMEEEKRKRVESKPLTRKEIRVILRNDDSSRSNQNDWVRRSRRQPSKALLKSKDVRMLIRKLKTNDLDMRVLKMKKYINDPNIPSAVLNAALNAMEENTNCEALYIQNFNEGMRDQQVLHLLRILQQPSSNIWCLNIGENYKVSHETWEKFTKGLIHTKITHMYASEHTITTDMKDKIRFTIRENRKKHDMHINPNNIDVIIQCTHCWWNPINATVLRPYLKKKGYEHVLNDMEAQGLRGSHSAAPSK